MLRNFILAGSVLSVLSACAAPILGPVGLTGSTPAPAATTPKERLVAAIEANNCVLTADNVGAVMSRANLTQADMQALTPQLQAEGRVEVAGSGAIRLLSSNCI